MTISRRNFLYSTSAAALFVNTAGEAALAEAQSSVEVPPVKAPWDMAHGRPPVAQRKFRSTAVEQFLTERQTRIADPALRALFVNCFPNTLDTTVEPGTYQGKPDTAVLTGDIAAMWLRDSSAQVWPYLPLAKNDRPLRDLLEGVIRRQARCILIDPYANAIMADLNAPPLPWSLKDKTDLKRGVGERKWEVDSLCYPIRLSHGYWKHTGDTGPFDQRWLQAMYLIVETFRVQQRKDGDGPYIFRRISDTSTETLPAAGLGNPVKPVGLIASGFRPSDDACIFPFLVPSNLFAVTSLRQLAEMAHTVAHDDELANKASSLAKEVEQALHQHAIATTPEGTIWAYEVDGYGSQLLMDDANVPSLLGLPYLDASPDPALYNRTRAFCWSPRNPWFFQGTAGEGIGGPHVGRDMIWPMSQIIYALTSSNPDEIRRSLHMLKGSAQGFGFMHESYFKNDPKNFTRAWFAWANTLFGELLGTVAATHPELLQP
ncbi:glycoside hydrolase family 125 protein [Edaphobacter flagellatus]|uniref:glycoside hydrolase family 125 protein n=1 Tax=Edaphobacter flagellatus TaxID=1933044 RepID=UPI0021B3214D|nr:glycoside hydrolase family 125 protein [Edaphobacter flagellatus]